MLAEIHFAISDYELDHLASTLCRYCPSPYHGDDTGHADATDNQSRSREPSPVLRLRAPLPFSGKTCVKKGREGILVIWMPAR